jgi:hypothetical protein
MTEVQLRHSLGVSMYGETLAPVAAAGGTAGVLAGSTSRCAAEAVPGWLALRELAAAGGTAVVGAVLVDAALSLPVSMPCGISIGKALAAGTLAATPVAQYPLPLLCCAQPGMAGRGLPARAALQAWAAAGRVDCCPRIRWRRQSLDFPQHPPLPSRPLLPSPRQPDLLPCQPVSTGDLLWLVLPQLHSQRSRSPPPPLLPFVMLRLVLVWPM